MDYIENFTKENDMDFDLYDSAKYAAQNRSFEKTTSFDKDLFEKYKRENLSINVKYPY